MLQNIIVVMMTSGSETVKTTYMEKWQLQSTWLNWNAMWNMKKATEDESSLAEDIKIYVYIYEHT